MATIAATAAFAIFVWWSSTILILHLDGLRSDSFRWSLAGATLVLAAGIWGIGATAADTSISGAWAAFLSALAVWGWNEVAFLMGYVTGPRKQPCSPSCRGARRFAHAAGAIMFHECALLGSAGVVAVVTYDAPNKVAMWTFGALWVMRLSAKLNIFLGVPRPGAELLPDRVAHLRGYFRKRPLNALFPLSVTGLTLVAALLIYTAAQSQLPSFDRHAATLLAALVVLGLLEHWLLVLPISTAPLWRAGLQSRRRNHRSTATARAVRPLLAGASEEDS